MLQLGVCEQPVARAARAAEAIRMAGLAVAQAYQSDRLSREFVLAFLKSVPPPERTELFRRAMDPGRRWTPGTPNARWSTEAASS